MFGSIVRISGDWGGDKKEEEIKRQSLSSMQVHKYSGFDVTFRAPSMVTRVV